MATPYAQLVDASNPNKLKLLWDANFTYSTIDENGFLTSASIPYGLNQMQMTMAGVNARRGTNWFLKDGGNEVWHTKEGQDLAYNTTNITAAQIAGAVVIETTKEVEGFTLTLSVPALYEFNKTSGYAPSHEVVVGIYYKILYAKPSDDPSPDMWNCLDPNYKISSTASRTEIIKTVSTYTSTDPESTSRKLPLARYKILVIRLTENHTGSFDFADEVYVKELTEMVFEELSYPHTAMLGIKIRATDQLSGSPPIVTSLVKGIKVSVPDNLVSGANYNQWGYSTPWSGNLSPTKVWTDNPVWCLYDLLTNKRYGMADYYKINPAKIGLMRANFYLMAKYCDEQVASSDTKDPAGTTANGVASAHVRRRFTLNMVLDQSKSASDWVAAIAAIMRASVFYSEGIFWIDIDRPKLMTQIFNMTSIKEYTQSGTSYRGIPNTYEVQWINPEASYEVDVFRLESEEFRLNQALEERKKALLLLGVTSFDQAKALGKYALYAGMYRTKLITFKTHTAGLRSMVGDVVGIQHDVPLWGWGGKVQTVFLELDGSYTLTISSPYDYTSSTTGLALTLAKVGWPATTLPVINPVIGVGQVTIRVTSISQQNPDTRVIQTIIPVVGDSYILGMATNAVNPFKISAVKRDSDEYIEIMAVEYDAKLYDKCDDTSDLGAWVSTDYSLIKNPIRTSVSGVNAAVKLYKDSSGTFKTGVEVFYDTPKGFFWRSAEIWYALAGTGNYTLAGVSTSGYYFIPDISVEGTYQIVVCSVFSSGKQSVADTLNDTISNPYAIVEVNPYVPNEYFMLGVSGLSIVNQANDGTFTGKDCRVKWNRPLAVDAAVNTSADGVAGSSSVDNWFKNYQVEVRDVTFASGDIAKNTPIPGSIRRTTTVYDESFIYSHEANHSDLNGVARTFQITVVAYDRLGRSSQPKTIICSNPAPLAFT